MKTKSNSTSHDVSLTETLERYFIPNVCETKDNEMVIIVKRQSILTVHKQG